MKLTHLLLTLIAVLLALQLGVTVYVAVRVLDTAVALAAPPLKAPAEKPKPIAQGPAPIIERPVPERPKKLEFDPPVVRNRPVDVEFEWHGPTAIWYTRSEEARTYFDSFHSDKVIDEGFGVRSLKVSKEVHEQARARAQDRGLTFREVDWEDRIIP